MKKFVLILCMAFIAYSQQLPQSYYNWADTINVSAVDWTCPDSAVTVVILTTQPGTVKVQMRRGAVIPFSIDSLGFIPGNFYKIYKTGTSSALQSGNLRVIGYTTR